MDRMTATRVIHRAEVVNRMLRGVNVETQGRNGYTALDLYDHTGCVRTLIVGTRREVYTYLDGMVNALEIVGR